MPRLKNQVKRWQQ